LFLLVVCTACTPETRCQGLNHSEAPLHILFIGNSYTYVNDLPAMFSKLACAGGHKVETAMVAEGGWTLSQHATSADTLNKISQQKWDFVSLQEQSEVPAIETSRIQIMYPAARQLVAKIKAQGAKPLLMLTWGHRSGLPEAGIANYNDMQAQLDIGYQGIAQELNIGMVPIGYAWGMARLQQPPLDLWQDDGSHPNQAGTYLAACVFYAQIFRQNPQGLDYLADLNADTAQNLQSLAWRSVSK
jgi:hypothetical protein